MNRKVLGFLALAALIVAAATLTPKTPPPGEPLRSCLVCGDTGVADVVVNVFLFVPIGVALAAAGVTWALAGALGGLFSVGLELGQTLIPGRDASIGDVVFNTIGSAVGAVIAVTSRWWLVPKGRDARLLTAGATATAIGTWLGTAWLLQPAFPATRYWGQWTPDLPHLAYYGGRVLDARLGSTELPSFVLPDSARVRDRLLRGDTLSVVAEAGPPPAGVSSLFSIADDHPRNILLLGPDGTDLVVASRTRAASLRLHQPDHRFRRALAAVNAGDTLTVRAWRAGGRWCASWPSGADCGAWSPGIGWAVLVSSRTWAGWMVWLGTVGWMLFWGTAVGWWSSSPRVAALAAAMMAASLGAIHVATPLTALTPGAAATVSGVLFGRWIREMLVPKGARRTLAGSDTR